MEVGNDAHHCLCEEFHNVEVRLPRTQSLVKLEAVAASRCVRNLKVCGHKNKFPKKYIDGYSLVAIINHLLN